MFSEQINKAELAEVAKEFKRLLGNYACSLPAAREVLSRASPLIDKAMNGEIQASQSKGFFPEEFWESGALFEVSDLSEVCAKFNLLLRGASSIEEVRKAVTVTEQRAADDERTIRERGA